MMRSSFPEYSSHCRSCLFRSVSFNFHLHLRRYFFLAVIPGLAFIVSFFCYFTALFNDNDSSLAQTFWAFSVPVVPFLAWLVFGEVLEFRHYVGVVLSFFGILALVLYQKTRRGVRVRHFALPMMGATFLFSLSMILSNRAYAEGDFLNVFFVFCASAALGSLIILLAGYRSHILVRLGEIVVLAKKNFFWFVASEGMSLIAITTSQRALSLTPSATFIAMIEALVPVFIMLISLALIWSYRVIRRQNQGVELVLWKQLSGVRVKLFATFCLVIAIAFVT